ncbi:MAG: hypothetical protein A2Z11_01400 [Candidatus Woykebacteria bacterium RBG_16_43_9]|uniref:DUF4367 domain-containing protein n=1 Tax=Candidatus Woykebacteria bacterium RBG_16_43_9 TaxID=1802596 RepID=A0A1G1WCA2_9BACT|nr:MAG: hypothetical protein A2Z11_01400 [Candidatus Woykebacteria bacterium RBG_16_43_9]
MPEEQSQPNQQPKPSVNGSSFLSNKLTLLLVSIWLLLILVAAFYFLGLFRFINATPQGTSETSVYLSINRLNFTYLTVVGLINGLLVFLGLRWVKIARVFFHYIDLILIVLGIVGLIAGYSLPCEGLGCIGNGFLILGGASVLGSVFAHAPLFYLILNGANRKAIGVITALLVLLMILVPYVTYSYLAKTLPKKAEIGISQAKKELGITIFKPTYLPDKKVDKQFEEVNNIGEYHLFYSYQGEGIKGGRLSITERAPKGTLEEIFSYGARKITINGNQAAISTTESIQKDSYFSTAITWVENGTEIHIGYSGVGVGESIESEAIKIAESMKPI